MDQYNRLCDWYVNSRSQQIGVQDIAEFTRPLARGARVIDLGCGHGIPISRFLIEQGFELFALDSSELMIERFHLNFPSIPVKCARIQDSDFFNSIFDAAIAWGVLFHMTEDDQRLAIGKISQSMLAGGRFLFTSQKERIDDRSEMNGLTVPYISLGSMEYSHILKVNGFRLIDEHFDEGDNYVYISEKRA